MSEAELITTPAALEAALARLEPATRLAIDTEFMRERTYFPQLCLVQVASDCECFLFDPLAPLALGTLHALLGQRTRLKIVHAARQDLEVLSQDGDGVPGPIYDTQVAAALLGLAPQIGYAELVARRLAHSIDKGQTRTDWSRRPLTPEQIAYAADDVRHLLELHTSLDAELRAAGRAGWLEEDCLALENPALYRADTLDAGRRLKGLRRLRPEEQAVARAVANWREERAVAENRPRGWLLADDALYAIATRQPRTPADLAAIESLPPAVVKRRGTALLELVATALAAPVPAESREMQGKPTPQETARTNRLMQIVREEAQRLGIGAEMLATRRDIDALALNPKARAAPLEGWRGELLGARLRAAMD